MRSLPRQQRPGAPLAESLEGAAVMPLPIAIVVVASPAWPLRGIDLQHMIDHLESIHDHGIVRPAHAITHQLQKSPVDDLPRFELGLLSGASVRDVDHLFPASL